MSEIFTSCNYHTATYSGIIGINYVSSTEQVNKTETVKTATENTNTDTVYKTEAVVITNV